MLDGDALRAADRKAPPDHVVPEIEAIRTEVLSRGSRPKGFTSSRRHARPSSR